MATLGEFREFYNNNPSYFVKAGEGALQGMLLPSHKAVHEYIKSLDGKRICDFGCGAGNDIQLMCTPGNEYIGLDVSIGALTEARARFSPKNVEYHQVDFDEPLPLSDASSDVVTSFFVFEHLLQPTRTLREMMRILRPDGQLFLIAPNYGSPLKSAPPLGTPSKIKLVCKTFRTLKTMLRRILFPHASLDIRMIPIEKVDISHSWGPDMDATNEPWSWEIAAYLKAYGFHINAISTWEGQLKTVPERLFSRIGFVPFIRQVGPLCYIHAIKEVS